MFMLRITSYDRYMHCEKMHTHQNVQPVSTVLRELSINHWFPDEHEQYRDTITKVGVVKIQGTRGTVRHPAYVELMRIHMVHVMVIKKAVSVCIHTYILG